MCNWEKMKSRIQNLGVLWYPCITVIEMKGRFPEVLETILVLSVLPTILCAFAFVYGLVFCIQSLMNGEKMSESKHCRNMFLLAGASLALLLLLPNPWLYLYAS